MTLTETLRRLAEKVGGLLETEWVSDVQMFLSKCTPTNVIALCAVANAAREMREAGVVFIAVRSSDVTHAEWCNAKERVRQTECDLDAALAALDRVEG